MLTTEGSANTEKRCLQLDQGEASMQNRSATGLCWQLPKMLTVPKNNTEQHKKKRKEKPFWHRLKKREVQGGSSLWWCRAHLVRLEQSHADLDAAPLAVRDPIEAPLQVYVQKIDQLLAASGVHPLHSMNHLPCCQVTLQKA